MVLSDCAVNLGRRFEGTPMSEKETAEFTRRILLALVVDVSQLVETAERLKVQVFTLAKEHGIKPPKAES
jgi:hypothetical protein